MSLRRFLEHPIAPLDRLAKWALVGLVFAIPLSTAATSLTRALLLVLWLLAGGYCQRWRVVRASPFALACLLLFGIIILGTSYTSAPEAITGHLSKYAKLLFAAMAVSLLDEKPWRSRALQAFGLAMGITLCASLLHVIWPFGWAKSTADGVAGNHYIFTNHIQQNVMMALFAVLCIDQSRRRQGWTRHAALGLAGAALINVTFFVGSRTGHLALLCGLIAYAITADSWRVRMRQVLLVVLITIAVVATSSNVQQRADSVVNEVSTRSLNGLQTSSGLRLAFWTGSLELIQRHPVIGTGTGSYRKEFCTIERFSDWCDRAVNGHPHNQALHLWVENGLPGLLAFLAMVAAPLYMVRHASLRHRAAIHAFSAIFAVHSMLNASLFHIEGYFFLMLGAALLADYPTRRPQAGNAPDQSPQVPRHGHQQA